MAVALLCLVAAFYNFAGFNNLSKPDAGANSQTGPSATQGAFDFYVLSLSWSPTFCVEQNGREDEEQCGKGRPYAFVVHGLWPQNETGFPSACQSRFGTRIDGGIAVDMLDIMPSRDLVFHQWRKHGTCSGLSPDDFFDLTRTARQKIVIPRQFEGLTNHQTVSPAAVERAFMGANPKLSQNGIAVTCSTRYLKEVRICMDKTLNFRPCTEVDSKSCRAEKTIMPPVRG
jgi:ribonuclease T2